MRASYRHFTQVDVFTTRRFEGNGLAVFPKADGLTASRMQAIARELNLSETTFVFPGNRVRIFTPYEELPFAGHPTLGTAFVVARRRDKEVRLKLKIGAITVRISREAGRTYLEMRQKEPSFGPRLSDLEALAGALGLKVRDFDSRYPVEVVSTGLPFLIVPLQSSVALEQLNPAAALLRPILEQAGAHFPYYVVTGETEIEARMFDTRFEDPATGSAAGCAAAYLVQHGRCKPDALFVIRQGRFVCRPSKIFAAASLSRGKAARVRVGGYVVEALEGRLRL